MGCNYVYIGQLLLRMIEGLLNSEKYYRLLTNDIFPSLKATIESFIFQQDNAPCHNSQYTRRQIQMEGIEILTWHSHCPDLSPIEKIWSILKSKVHENGHFDDKEFLWAKIQCEASTIMNEDHDLFLRLYTRFYENMCDILCNHGELLK